MDCRRNFRLEVMDEVEGCPDEVAVLDRGRLQMVGTPEEVFTSGALNSAFGVTVKRVQSEDGWQYYCR